MWRWQVTKLATGLQVIKIPMAGISSVSVLALVKVGSRYETSCEWGGAHVLEHLVFKGTANFPNSRDLALTTDRIGAEMNAFTSKESTGFYVTLASNQFELGLKVVSQLVLAPLLKATDLALEQPVISEEIRLIHDQPDQYVGSLFDQLFYAGTGLSHDIAGTQESVNQLTVDTLVNFFRHWYRLNNIVLAVAGDAKVLRAKNFSQLITKYWSPIDQDRLANFQADGEARPSITAAVLEKISPAKNLATKSAELATCLAINKKQFLQHLATDSCQPEIVAAAKRVTIESRPLAQTQLILGWPGVGRTDSRRVAVSLLAVILGGNRSSRLFTQLREEKSWAYYVATSPEFFANEGALTVAAGLNNGHLEEGIKLTLELVAALATGQEPITAAELKAAQDFWWGKLVLGLEDSLSVAEYFGSRQLFYDQPESPAELKKRIKAVTRSELQHLAREIFQPGRVRLAAVGPKSDPAPFAKLLAKF